MLDHRQVCQLVVIAPVTVLSSTCSPPQRTGARWPPAWAMHSTCRRWIYSWETLTSAFYSRVCPFLATASLCRNCMWAAVHQVCTQGVQHTLSYIHSHTCTNTTHLDIYTTSIAWPQGKYSTCIQQPTPTTHALSSCMHAQHKSTQMNTPNLLPFTTLEPTNTCSHTRTDRCQCIRTHTHTHVQYTQYTGTASVCFHVVRIVIYEF